MKYTLLIYLLLLVACAQEPGDESPQADIKTEQTSENEVTEKGSAPWSRQVLYGDLHVHTSYSLDSYVNFNPVDPDMAYRFAQGEEVELSGGRKLKLTQPLDFAAVTEHGEYLGELAICLDESQSQYDVELCQDIRNEQKQRKLVTKVYKNLIIPSVLSEDPRRNRSLCPQDDSVCLQRAASVWKELQGISNSHNKPGEFTTFHAYEWTGNTNGNNLHRNIIFKNDAVLELPVSHYDANTPALLWRRLANECHEPCELLAIPHNSNQSNGKQFPGLSYSEESVELAELRQKLEPLVEIIQAKGESECHTGIGTNDEFCNNEQMERRTLCEPGTDPETSECIVVCDAIGKPEGCTQNNSYVRNALKEGLMLKESLGVNPYMFGFIGSTDTHNGTPGATEENNYQGHHGEEDGSPQIREKLPEVKEFSAHRMKGSGGLAAVWAEENTRASIFSALKRKEAFATSGTRIALRFFASWDYPEELESAENMLEIAYQRGVSMGSSLTTQKNMRSPNFLIWAMKGSDGVNLQRVQMIKAWVEDGEAHETTYDVACSDGLIPDESTKRCPDNGASVNLNDCSVSANRGAREFIRSWEDPEFKLSQSAFYYVRVLENPSCRWSTYEALRENKPFFDDVNPVIQERAWSSPIWYTP